MPRIDGHQQRTIESSSKRIVKPMSLAIQRLASRDAAATSCHNFHRDTFVSPSSLVALMTVRPRYQEPLLARVGARGEATL